MKVSPDEVAIPERKAWKHRHLVIGIATRLLRALFNFLEWRGPRAKETLRSMEQCFRAKAGKHRLLARTLFHDCSIEQPRDSRDFEPLLHTDDSLMQGRGRSRAV
jgi:hypothetical protein